MNLLFFSNNHQTFSPINISIRGSHSRKHNPRHHSRLKNLHQFRAVKMVSIRMASLVFFLIIAFGSLSLSLSHTHTHSCRLNIHIHTNKHVIIFFFSFLFFDKIRISHSYFDLTLQFDVSFYGIIGCVLLQVMRFCVVQV